MQPAFKTTAWPQDMDTDAFYGLAGEIVNTIAPHSEADKNGLLMQLLVAIGNCVGPSPYYRVESTKHHPNLFAVMVGDTAKARKGTSWQWIPKILNMADDHWHQCMACGMSSGEGIIYQVRDKDDDDDCAEPDRRLMIVEGEFAQALKVSRREGNTLSPVMRNAWDGGTLRTLTRNSPLTSTSSHISVVGHITQDELLRHLSQTDMANGFGNRFLWVCVRRSKLLPNGGNLDDDQLVPLAQQLREALSVARQCEAIQFDDATRSAWEVIYKSLSKSEAGLIGAMTARNEAQMARIAMLYALLNKSHVIQYEHLMAAKAVVNYCHRSVQYIFSSVTGNPIADAILQAIEMHGRVTRNMIVNLGARHWKKAQIDEAIGLLTDEYGVITVNEQTGGRTRTVLVRSIQ